MEELQERAVLKRGLMGSGVSFSREEQGKNKVKIAGFFLEPARGRAQRAGRGSAPSLGDWMEDRDRMGCVKSQKGLTKSQKIILSPALLPSPVDAERGAG